MTVNRFSSLCGDSDYPIGKSTSANGVIKPRPLVYGELMGQVLEPEFLLEMEEPLPELKPSLTNFPEEKLDDEESVNDYSESQFDKEPVRASRKGRVSGAIPGVRRKHSMINDRLECLREESRKQSATQVFGKLNFELLRSWSVVPSLVALTVLAWFGLWIFNCEIQSLANVILEGPFFEMPHPESQALPPIEQPSVAYGFAISIISGFAFSIEYLAYRYNSGSGRSVHDRLAIVFVVTAFVSIIAFNWSIANPAPANGLQLVHQSPGLSWWVTALVQVTSTLLVAGIIDLCRHIATPFFIFKHVDDRETTRLNDEMTWLEDHEQATAGTLSILETWMETLASEKKDFKNQFIGRVSTRKKEIAIRRIQ